MKQLLFLSCLSALACAMTPEQFSIVYNNTTINLKKGSITNAQVNLMVMGRNQQELLQKGQFNNDLTMGKITMQEKNNRWTQHIYHKSANEDSDSDDNTYKPFIFKNHPITSSQDLCFIETTKVEPIIFKIAEPCILISPGTPETANVIQNFVHYNFVYYNNEQNINGKIEQKRYAGDEAITKASEKLTLCYKNALSLGLLKLYDVHKRRIAFDTLSTGVGFPREKAVPIAVHSIIDFINNFPDAYNCIELFVKKRFDFKLYKKLLQTTLSNDNIQDCLAPEDIMISNLLSCIFNHQLSFDITYDELKKIFYEYIFNNECCNNNKSHHLSNEQLYQIFLETTKTEITELLHQIFSDTEDINDCVYIFEETQ